MPLYISDEQLNHTKQKGFNIFKDLLKLYKKKPTNFYLSFKFHLFISIIFRIKFVVSGGEVMNLHVEGGTYEWGGKRLWRGGMDPG